MRKRLLCLLLCSSLTISLVTGCGNVREPREGADTKEVAESVAEGEEVTEDLVTSIHIDTPYLNDLSQVKRAYSLNKLTNNLYVNCHNVEEDIEENNEDEENNEENKKEVLYVIREGTLYKDTYDILAKSISCDNLGYIFETTPCTKEETTYFYKEQIGNALIFLFYFTIGLDLSECNIDDLLKAYDELETHVSNDNIKDELEYIPDSINIEDEQIRKSLAILLCRIGFVLEIIDKLEEIDDSFISNNEDTLPNVIIETVKIMKEIEENDDSYDSLYRIFEAIDKENTEIVFNYYLEHIEEIADGEIDYDLQKVTKMDLVDISTQSVITEEEFYAIYNAYEESLESNSGSNDIEWN